VRPPTPITRFELTQIDVVNTRRIDRRIEADEGIDIAGNGR
jgi:hypothetical protein